MNSLRRCRITRIHGGGELREDSVSGLCGSEPAVGRRFGLVSDPLEDGYHVRLITTSPVQAVYGSCWTDDGNGNSVHGMRIRTLSGSIYIIEIEEDVA